MILILTVITPDSRASYATIGRITIGYRFEQWKIQSALPVMGFLYAVKCSGNKWAMSNGRDSAYNETTKCCSVKNCR